MLSLISYFLLTASFFDLTLSLTLTNATVPVRIEFTTCASTSSGMGGAIYISFPSVPSFPSQQLTGHLSTYDETFSQVYFLEEYPSSLRLSSESTDALCLTSIVVNDIQVPFPEGNIWLDNPCSGTYNGGEICRESNDWSFTQVDYGVTKYGVQVEFTTCASTSSTSSDDFIISFPSVPSFPPQPFTDYFSSPSTTYIQTYYPLDSLPTDLSIQSLTTDSLCLSGLTINQIPLNFTTEIWLDNPCTSPTYSGAPCYTTYTWNFTNLPIYGDVMYYYYHTCTYSDSSSISLNFYIDFPTIPNYGVENLEWTFTSSSNWFYQMYYLTNEPSELSITAASSDEICLDSIRYNENSAMYFQKSHYYLSDPCKSSYSGETTSNYTKYCKTSVTWNVNKTNDNKGGGDDDTKKITVDDIQFLILGALISALTTVGLMVCGLLICCCYIQVPMTRKYLGKDEVIADRMTTTNPINDKLETTSPKKTIVVPPVEIRLNATSGAPQADAINQEYDHIINLALQDIARLAEGDQIYLIGKIRFSVSSSKITKMIEFVTITILGSVALTYDHCPNWFCKMYLTISIYLWFLTVILRFERYPFSRPNPPKPIVRTIYQRVVAQTVSRYQDRVYYEWDRNQNGRPVRAYEEPEIGTDEIQIAADFQKYQQTLKKQNRLHGSVFQYTPRDWNKERAEAKASVEETNARNAAIAREENLKREAKQQEMDRERHEQDKNNLETYRLAVINHELWITGWEVMLSYVYCLVSLCSVLLFLVGLFWNVTCSGAGSIICNFIVFPTIVFEFMFIITYTKREKMAFEARKEVVINV